VEKRLPNSLERMVLVPAPYTSEIVGVAVELTLNWYWLADGLTDQGYVLHLVNTLRSSNGKA
jgi:hypothetical protein